MPSTYKEKLIDEIETIPEKMLPRFYRIVSILKTELYESERKTASTNTLKGIWKGSDVDEKLFEEAKKSLFPYERDSDLV